eukprot:SAG31_NODE_31851_length_363_cov_0.821970_1_plen_45_part_10
MVVGAVLPRACMATQGQTGLQVPRDASHLHSEPPWALRAPNMGGS